MRLGALILTACAWAALTSALPRDAVAQKEAAAIVEEIRGKTFWRRSAADKEMRLDKAHIARPLYPGEQVRRTRGSVLRLRLGREPILVPPSVWFTIPERVLPRSDPFRRILNIHADVTGIVRVDPPPTVFSPAKYGAAVPRPFIIRWKPSPRGCRFSLVIEDVEGRKIWRRDDVVGSTGFLALREVERRLQHYRAIFGRGPLELELTILDSCGTESLVNFSLLSVEKERSLKRDLAFWGEGVGALIAHMGRASVYSEYRMFSHAAEEYEAALKGAPRSTQLLLMTIRANYMTGNFGRAMELERHLPAGTSVR